MKLSNIISSQIIQCLQYIIELFSSAPLGKKGKEFNAGTAKRSSFRLKLILSSLEDNIYAKNLLDTLKGETLSLQDLSGSTLTSKSLKICLYPVLLLLSKAW
jgi:hypothetical protein